MKISKKYLKKMEEARSSLIDDELISLLSKVEKNFDSGISFKSRHILMAYKRLEKAEKDYLNALNLVRDRLYWFQQ